MATVPRNVRGGVPLTGGVAGALLAEKRKDVRYTRRLYRVALILRISIGLLGYIATEYAGLPLLQDALYYEEVGYSVASDWWSGNSSEWLDTVDYGGRVTWLMVAVIAAIYYVLGFRSIPLLLVAYGAITALVPVYTYHIGCQMGAPRSVARRAAWLVALSPAFVFWSGALYKEGLILLFLNVATYHTLRLQARWDIRSVVFLVAAIFGTLGLRFYLAPLVVGAAMIALLWGRGRGHAGRTAVPVVLRQGIVVILFITAISVLGFSERLEKSLIETDQGVLIEADLSRRDMAARSESGYLGNVEVLTIEDAARFMPVGLLYFLTVPHPWQLGSFRQNVTIPETMLWVALYPLIVVGFVRGLRVNAPGTLFVLLVTSGLCVTYAVLSGNIGVAYRMRAQVWLLWAPFAAWGFDIWRRRRGPQKAERRRAVGGRVAER